MLNATARIVGLCRANNKPNAPTSPCCAASTRSASAGAPTGTISVILRQHLPFFVLRYDDVTTNEVHDDFLPHALPNAGRLRGASPMRTRAARPSEPRHDVEPTVNLEHLDGHETSNTSHPRCRRLARVVAARDHRGRRLLGAAGRHPHRPT